MTLHSLTTRLSALADAEARGEDVRDEVTKLAYQLLAEYARSRSEGRRLTAMAGSDVEMFSDAVTESLRGKLRDEPVGGAPRSVTELKSAEVLHARSGW